MTREEAIIAIHNSYPYEIAENIIEALKAEPCGSAVGNGTPLDIVFEDIKAEIKGECNNRENVKDDEIEIGVSLGLEKALKIIDKHIGGEQK